MGRVSRFRTLKPVDPFNRKRARDPDDAATALVRVLFSPTSTHTDTCTCVLLTGTRVVTRWDTIVLHTHATRAHCTLSPAMHLFSPRALLHMDLCHYKGEYAAHAVASPIGNSA